METSHCCNSVAGHQIATNFAHATIAQLSCHVQNVVAITVLESRWEWNEISIEFELRWKKPVSETGRRISEQMSWRYQSKYDMQCAFDYAAVTFHQMLHKNNTPNLTRGTGDLWRIVGEFKVCPNFHRARTHPKIISNTIFSTLLYNGALDIIHLNNNCIWNIYTII